VLLLIAFATAAAGWEASALAGEQPFSWATWGTERDNDEIMVTFEVWDPSPPMPHFVLDETIPALYLDHDHSELIAPPSYYKNVYDGIRGGFVSGKTYRASWYLKVGQSWGDPIYTWSWGEP
jgi:hypothetical protein